MSTFTGPFLAFILTGSYLLFWPVYRTFLRRMTQRRQALFRLFLLELALYLPFTTLVITATYMIRDFHHAFLLVEVIYFLLALFFWVATYGVWADHQPEPCVN